MKSISIRQAKLKELACFETTGRIEDNLYRLACIVADLLGARRVSVMLMDSTPGHGPRLKLVALHGELPEAAWKDEPAPGQGIAGKVLSSGQSVRIASVSNSPWKDHARRPGEPESFLACPIPLAGRPSGVLNASDPVDRKTFSAADLELAELAAMLIGRIVHMARVERLLDSRLAQMAFALEGSTDANSVAAMSAHEPDKVSRMLARAFYREMRHCGFTPNQIIHAAGEIISELTTSLNRAKTRIERG
jgi:L-methionine (R)-S-oxide reductase